MSNTPTYAMQAPNSSGCWARHAPTSRPPLEPPSIAIRSARDQPESASQRAQAQKSSNTFCLTASMPSSRQALPYSPPPRRLATASMPPVSSHAACSTRNEGVIGMSNPPYPYSSTGTSPVGSRSVLLVKNIDIAVPSSEVANTCSVTYFPGSMRAVDGRTSSDLPAAIRYDQSEPDSANDVTPKCIRSLDGLPESPVPLPHASPIEASRGSGISPARLPSSSCTRSTECALCR